MALTQRQTSILEYLKKNKYAKINELAANLYVSTSTVRREIVLLKKLGLLERNHGGAAMLDSGDEIAVYVRYGHNVEDKQRTIETATDRLPEFKNVFIDNSSTALMLARRINLQYKTVVTNGLNLAMELSRKNNITVIMPGGNLNLNSNALTGSYTIRCLSDMNFDLLLCSCTAIYDGGAYESSLEQSELKRVVLHNSRKKIMLADKEKFHGIAMHKTANLSEFDVVYTNADDRTVAPLKEKYGVNIVNK